MKRNILLGAALLILIVSGVVHGFWTGRWDTDTDSATPRLETIALDLPDWQGQNIEVPAQARPGINGLLYRKYIHRVTGQAITVYLICGRSGPVSIHTPDSCYAAAGYKVLTPSKYVLNDEPNQTKHEFRTARMVRSSQGDQSQLRIFWAWTDRGRWQVPDDPRLVFPHQNGLYKLYLINDRPRSGDVLDGEPCVELMKQLLPEMKRSLFGEG